MPKVCLVLDIDGHVHLRDELLGNASVEVDMKAERLAEWQAAIDAYKAAQEDMKRVLMVMWQANERPGPLTNMIRDAMLSG